VGDLLGFSSLLIEGNMYVSIAR